MTEQEKPSEITRVLEVRETNPLLVFFRAHERTYQRFGDELRKEGYQIDEIYDDTMLVQIGGRFSITRDLFFFHGKRFTLRLDVGKFGAQERDSERKWVGWTKNKFLDKNGEAQDTFDLDEDSDKEDVEVLDLTPKQIIDIFKQLVSEYRKDTSVEGEFTITS